MLAVTLFFRRELWALTAALGRGPDRTAARHVLVLLFAASLPTAVIGFGMRDVAEVAFHSPPLVGTGLLVTSALLLSTLALRRRADERLREADGDAGRWLDDLAGLRVRDAVVVGLAQGVAVWPGISRSGSTIAAARHLDGLPEGLGVQLVGFALAFAVGWLAIGWLMAAVRGSRLAWFAVYTAILGSIGLAAAWMS
jgi:undecaprenyl-diphosphatase